MGQLTLEALCRKKGYTQETLAEALKVSRAAVGKWMRGEAQPHAPIAFLLANLLGVDDAAELFQPEKTATGKLEQDIAMDYLNRLDRRELFVLLQGLPVLASIDFALFESPHVAPDEFLSQANAAINGCKQLMRYDGMNSVESILSQFLPRLTNLASHPSEFQDIAAPLAVQAKILQIFFATRKGDFIGRKLLCLEAVKFGELSGDDSALISALNWQGDTYIYCYRQPRRAIPTFEDALSKISSDTLTKQGVLYANLSIAYAQLGDESRAEDLVEQARKFRGTLDLSAVDRYDGRVHLYLAEYFPNKGYAKLANDAFERSLDTSSPEGISYHTQTLIHKANAALLMGKLDEYTACLEQGMNIASRIGSEELKQRAHMAYNNVPERWLTERRYQQLGTLF